MTGEPGTASRFIVHGCKLETSPAVNWHLIRAEDSRSAGLLWADRFFHALEIPVPTTTDDCLHSNDLNAITPNSGHPEYSFAVGPVVGFEAGPIFDRYVALLKQAADGDLEARIAAGQLVPVAHEHVKMIIDVRAMCAELQDYNPKRIAAETKSAQERLAEVERQISALQQERGMILTRINSLSGASSKPRNLKRGLGIRLNQHRNCPVVAACEPELKAARIWKEFRRGIPGKPGIVERVKSAVAPKPAPPANSPGLQDSPRGERVNIDTPLDDEA